MITSHIKYDHPNTIVLQILPTLPKLALRTLKDLLSTESDQSKSFREFGPRLGNHLCFYYWNAAFTSEDEANSTLDEFFRIAPPSSRALTIGEIGRVFENAVANEEHRPLFGRVMNLWEHRFSTITQIVSGEHETGSFDEELSRFASWLECQCFPEDWRVKHVILAINTIEVSAQEIFISDGLRKLESVKNALAIVKALLEKDSEILRWSFVEQELHPILLSGLRSADTSSQRLARDVQDQLLQKGMFQYLDVQ